MARLTAVSGTGGKLPAAFLLEVRGKRLLLDLGEGPEPGILPDVDGLGPVDAICLTHAHVDHAGALCLAPLLGDPPIYATATTFRQLGLVPGTPRHRVLPGTGEARVADLAVTLGRNGHAPGGVWMHFPFHGGILYTGDWSLESRLLPFDPPPRSALVVTDASYGDRDTGLDDQVDAIASAAAGGAVLAVPSGGRGPELALALAARGLKPRTCATVLAETRALSGDSDGPHADQRQALRTLAASLEEAGGWSPRDVIVAAEANGEAGTSAELVARIEEGFRFIFSGHVPAGTPAAALLAAGTARWMPWNVHPRRQDILYLSQITGAAHVMPAFVAPGDMPRLAHELGGRLVPDSTVDLRAEPSTGMET